MIQAANAPSLAAAGSIAEFCSASSDETDVEPRTPLCVRGQFSLKITWKKKGFGGYMTMGFMSVAGLERAGTPPLCSLRAIGTLHGPNGPHTVVFSLIRHLPLGYING